MEVTAHERGVTIDLTPTELADLAEFLGHYYEGDTSVMDQLSERLEAILEEKGYV